MSGSPWSSAGLEVLRTDDFPGGQLSRPGTYVVCFAAAWCPATRRFMPHFVAFRGSIPATLAIADITDNNDRLWEVFRIRITPSIVIFREGEPVSRIDGRRFIGITRSALVDLANDSRWFPRKSGTDPEGTSTHSPEP